MKKARKNRCLKSKGNLILEYSIVIAIVIAALVGMQLYAKRAICGRWRQSAEVFSAGRQYEPDVTQIIKVKGGR